MVEGEEEPCGVAAHAASEETTVTPAHHQRRIAGQGGSIGRQLQHAAAVGVIETVPGAVVQLRAVVRQLHDLAFTAIPAPHGAEHAPAGAIPVEHTEFVGRRAAGVQSALVKDFGAIAADADVVRGPEVVSGERVFRESAAVAVHAEDPGMPIVVEHIEDDAVPVTGHIKCRTRTKTNGSAGIGLPKSACTCSGVTIRRMPLPSAFITYSPALYIHVRPHIPVNGKENLRTVGRETEVRIGAELNHLVPVGAVGVDHVCHNAVPVEHLRSVRADVQRRRPVYREGYPARAVPCHPH